MFYEKRYHCLERNETGRLIGTRGFQSLEEFDQEIAKYPPVADHTITVYDSWTPLDPFGICYNTVREIIGT